MDIKRLVKPFVFNSAIYGMRSSETASMGVKQPSNGKGLVCLDRNENRFDCSDRVLAKIQETVKDPRFFGIYPDSDAIALKKMIADIFDTSPSNVVIGNGSIEIIRLIAHALLNPIDNVLTLDPSYEMYETIANTYGCELVKADSDDLFVTKPSDIVNKARHGNVKMLFLCNPNNPTGTLLSQDSIETIANDLPNSLILIDEAYGDYTQTSSVPLHKSFNNVIVTRSLSKAFGLASLRIGYGIGDKEFIDILNRVRIPCCVNSFAQIAAIAALEDAPYYKNIINLTIQERHFLLDQISGISGFKVYSSETNFLLVKVLPPRMATEVWQYLLSEGFLVRIFKHPRLKNFFRFSVGTHVENESFIETLKHVSI